MARRKRKEHGAVVVHEMGWAKNRGFIVGKPRGGRFKVCLYRAKKLIGVASVKSRDLRVVGKAKRIPVECMHAAGYRHG